MAETPEDELVRIVNQPAAVIIEEQDESVRLAASVPDIGWQYENEIVSRGLSYASRHFAFQRAKEHTLRLVLRGDVVLRGRRSAGRD